MVDRIAKSWPKKLLFPVHFSGFHWALVVLDTVENSTTYYDSRFTDVPQEIETNATEWWDCIDIQFKLKEMQRKFNCEKVPQQQHDFDSGIFLCQFMKSIVLGQKIHFTAEDIPNLRESMKKEIQNSSLEVNQ